MYKSNQINVKTREPYKGGQGSELESIHSQKNYKSNEWGTFLTWKELDRNILKGEKSFLCFYPTMVKTGKFDKDGKEKLKKRRQYFRVFNKDQTKETN